MPLWKDIETKAAKLGVTVEQGPESNVIRCSENQPLMISSP